MKTACYVFTFDSPCNPIYRLNQYYSYNLSRLTGNWHSLKTQMYKNKDNSNK